MRVEASNSKLRPKSPIHNGGPMVSSDLTFLTIGVKILTLSLGHYVGTNLFRISYFIIITLVQRGRGVKVQNWPHIFKKNNA
jgi:hypothetical protein